MLDGTRDRFILGKSEDSDNGLSDGISLSEIDSINDGRSDGLDVGKTVSNLLGNNDSNNDSRVLRIVFSTLLGSLDKLCAEDS